MIYLNVSYDQKDIAKSMGARWDPEKKLWYAPDDSFKELIETFGALASRKKLTVNINKKNSDSRDNSNNKENKNKNSKININRTFLRLNNNSFGNSLYVDLVPKKNNLAFYSLKANLSNNDYYEIKNLICQGNGYKCDLCGFSSMDTEKQILEKTKLNLCERWSYSLDNKKQKLEKIIGICDKCMITTRLKDKYIALEHLVNINGYNQETAKKNIFNAFEQWKKYNEIEWTLDLSLLNESGYFLKKSIVNPLDITNNSISKNINNSISNSTSNSNSNSNSNNNSNSNSTSNSNNNSNNSNEITIKKITISKKISTLTSKEKQGQDCCLIDFDSD